MSDSISHSRPNCSITNLRLASLFGSEFQYGEGFFAPSDRVTVAPHNHRTNKTIFIRDLADSRVSLYSPLPLSIDNWGSTVTAYSQDTGEFSVALDEISAVDEIRALLVDLYFILKENRLHLGPVPARHWNFLSTMIREN
jgi:hypothetical protein